ncbi:hypothetical protein RclHR1_02150019 [Rhizophagus clarus]|uniref:Uncharacterized protein n=1 Tax=Rhizophagus clarus TaxID=94130 RepID=A0A2Z6QXN2_9GLOM|nr:hypothetical protein RclHR1_02150019 [Rhizophagus clarus]
MALPDILRNVGTALDRIERYINGDTSFDPRNTLNGIRISLTTVRGHMQRHAQDAINLQGLLYIANGQINNLMNDLANTRNDVFQRTQLLNLAYNNEANEHHRWYQIAQERQTNAVAGFNAGARANVMKGKMTERFHPVSANDPYIAGNPAINTEPLWLQGRYREIMVGTNQDALRSLMNEKFTAMDMADTYEKRVKPYVQGIPYADAIEYLYGHMPQYMKMRLRQANPANLDAFFTDLRRIWLKNSLNEGFKAITFMKQLAGDLQYTGLTTDVDTLDHFIYGDLEKRFGRKATHVRRSPFSELQVRNTNATKKAVRKAGHIKLNCPKADSPGVKRTKKVNYVYQDGVEVPENSEEEYIEEYIVEEEDEAEEEEIEEVEDDEEEYDDNESQGATKKSPTSKSHANKAPISKASSNIIMDTDQMYQIALKSIIASVVPHCPKEILIEISKFINAIEPKLKDHCLNTVMPNDTVKRRELAWENVISKVQDVLLLLMQVTNAKQKLLLQVPDNKESIQSASNPNEGIVMADSTKIKEINTTSTSHVLPENHALAPSTWLEHAIKAYATAQKKNSQIY